MVQKNDFTKIDRLQRGAYIYKIQWDTDGENVDLPREVFIDITTLLGWTNDGNIFAMEDEISDYLSNEYGFCHNGFIWRLVY